MSKQFFVGFRLNKEEYVRLGALVRKSGKKKSVVLRELLMKGDVKERINKDHIQLIRQLAGESTNLNQLARKETTFGFHDIARKGEELVENFRKIIKRIKYDG